MHARAGGWTRGETFGRERGSTLCADPVGAIGDAVSRPFEFRQVRTFLVEQRGNPRSLERERRSFGVVFIIRVALDRCGDDVVELGRQRLNVRNRRSLLRIEQILWVPFAHGINGQRGRRCGSRMARHYQASSCSYS